MPRNKVVVNISADGTGEVIAIPANGRAQVLANASGSPEMLRQGLVKDMASGALEATLGRLYPDESDWEVEQF